MILLSLALVDLLTVPVLILELVKEILAEGFKDRTIAMVGFYRSGFDVTFIPLNILHLSLTSLELLIAIRYSLRCKAFVTRSRIVAALLGIRIWGLFETAVLPTIIYTDSFDVYVKFRQALHPCISSTKLNELIKVI